MNERDACPGVPAGNELLQVLAATFGYRSFRPGQEDVVRAILSARDTFTIMPTGGGKSLCYQLPARLMPGTCVVVSPLLSLMKDQVDAARGNGLAAYAFNSASSPAEKNAVRRAFHNDELDLLYVSPERLRLPDFQAYLKERRLSFFAIDEAHCISQWGHDFRPDYLALSELSSAFPGVSIAAFTATATRRVEEDIARLLNLRDPFRSRASFNRPNLFYQVTPKEDVERQILDFARSRGGESGIIYRATRKKVEESAARLKAGGLEVRCYHAGLGDAERASAQEAFRRDECRIIVATVAFGMGIDKPNVRYVLHGDLPKSLENYYQETGRAGRDGEAAHCALFYGRGDIAQLMRFAGQIEDEEARAAVKNQLYRMLDFTQKDGCRRKALLAYFGEDLPVENCAGCDICTGEAEREDATVAAQKLLSAMVRTGGRFGARHIIQIVMGKETRRILDFEHHRLPTFGVGKDQKEIYWRRVMDVILARNLATVADPLYPTPVVGDEGWKVLRGGMSVSIVRQAKTAEAAEAVRKRRRAAPALGSELLFELLREARTCLAKEARVPAYVIFSDRTLYEMAERVPQIPVELLAVNGVGRHKLDAYGGVFLEILREWRKEHPKEQKESGSGGQKKV